MCGIAGFCDYSRDFRSKKEKWNDILVNMRLKINHRGGDQSGEYLTENVGLAHARL